MNPEVPPNNDGVMTALSHVYWRKTLVHIAEDDSNPMAQSVAEIALVLLEGAKHDPKVIDYLNDRAARALNGRK